MDLGLHDRVAIVTGASRGIGRRIAIDLASEGARVVLVGRDATALAEVAAQAPGATIVVADLAEHDAAARVVHAAVDTHGRLDILVNNAGGFVPKKLLATTPDDWQAGFEQNFFSAVRMALACVPHLQAGGWGRIVNVASTFAKEPDPYFGPYSAAKAALVNFSKNLSVAYSADGVLTNCVVLGVTLTEGVEANAAAAAARTGLTRDEVMARMMAKDPVAVGRFGETAEVAAAVLFLVSERSSWTTGATLTVDGGTLHAAG